MQKRSGIFTAEIITVPLDKLFIMCYNSIVALTGKSFKALYH